MQFGDDWPGVFIRGDNAFGYAAALDRLLQTSDGSEAMGRATVEEFKRMLLRCTSSDARSAQRMRPFEECALKDAGDGGRP